MQTITVSPIAISSFLCLIINVFFSNNNIISSLANSLALGLSIYLAQSSISLPKTKFLLFFIPLMGFIPLFHYAPIDNVFSLFLLLILIFLCLLQKKSNIFLLILFGLVIFIGNLYLSGLVKPFFEVQYPLFIFNSPEVNFNIQRHQLDALYIPYQLRLIIYSQLINIYVFLANLFNLFNIKNLSDILLLANFYPFFLGLYNFFTKKTTLTKIYLIAIITTFFIAGIDRSIGSFKSLYLLAPVFVYIILLGFKSINKVFYLIIFIVSLFILISPKL